MVGFWKAEEESYMKILIMKVSKSMNVYEYINIHLQLVATITPQPHNEWLEGERN